MWWITDLDRAFDRLTRFRVLQPQLIGLELVPEQRDREGRQVPLLAIHVTQFEPLTSRRAGIAPPALYSLKLG
jgi:hypothetical protein